MPILGPVPYVFSPGNVAKSSEVDTNFNSIVSGVNSGAAARGINSDITQLNALTNFSSTNGTVTGTFTVGVINASGIATFANNIVMSGTGAIQIAAGSTGQRPGSPVVGDVRYNTTINAFEGYGGATPGWSSFGSATGFPLFMGLRIGNNVVTPNTKVDITALLAQTVNTSNLGIVRSSVSVTIDATTVGANGLDVGSLAASTWYFIWLIDTGSAIAGLLSLSSTAPNLPAGYTFKGRVGAIRTTAASQFFRTLQFGARARYQVTAGSNTTLYPILTTITVSGSVATAFSVSNGIPPTATTILVYLNGPLTIIRPSADAGSDIVGSTQTTTDITLQSTNLYYVNVSSPSGDIRAVGWVDNVVAF